MTCDSVGRSKTSPSRTKPLLTFERLSDHVYLLNRELDPQVEIIFFHGIQQPGSDTENAYWRSWKLRNEEKCWPVELLPKVCRTRILSVTYEGTADVGSVRVGATDKYLISENLEYDLISSAEVGQKENVPVILVGHDLGGLLIKDFVLMLEKNESLEPATTKISKRATFLKNLSAVFFYATPHSGSEAITKLTAKIPKDSKNLMFSLMKVLNTDQARINSEFRAFRKDGGKRIKTYALHAAHGTKQGGFDSDDPVVPEGSARNDTDVFHTILADHFGVCQPENETSDSAKLLMKHMEEAIQRGNPEKLPESTRPR